MNSGPLRCASFGTRIDRSSPPPACSSANCARVAASNGPVASETPAWMFISRGSHTPGNGWPIVIDARMSSTRTSHAAGQEVHPDVVERVLDDLVLGGIDP